jgi:iron complex outermembrane receptor protein
VKKHLLLLCSTACVFPTAAFAQSTGTVDFEKDTIVVTGTRTKDVGGIEVPDAPKAKAVLTQEVISRQNPGQTILDTINLVPGVSFQNNDAYGSSGGNLTIRGFDSSRISLTFDGIQLNDSGNYAIYSNQQLDPELIEQVNVNLGSTDVDSPTASAVGGTVNYRTIVPTKDMNGRISGSLGQFDFRRIFGLFNTGEIGPWGTRVFVAASTAKNKNPFNNYSKVDKQQYNARIWQPIGANGDFVSVAGHYNENRNNFFGSLPLRWDAGREVGPGSGDRFPRNNDEREYDINYPCSVEEPTAGVADFTNSCGTEFERRYNPSNTGNIRGQSRFTLAQGIVLTVDPSFQYVKANGGGTVTGREQKTTIGTISDATGYVGNRYYLGRDLNGDGDTLDQVTLLAPSQTRTDRYGVIAGLRWEINPNNMVRISYTLDHAHHRQTGQLGYLQSNGEPVDVFPMNDPIIDSNGFAVQKRDRKSLAILNQVSAEYRGTFGPLLVNVGVRAPFFKRDLNNYCFTTSSTGFVDCFGGNAAINAAYAAANPGVQGPQRRVFKYDKLLPNLGLVYDFTNQISAFASYTKGLSVPSTDNLYNSFFFAPDTDEASPTPETTDSFDAGLRYRSSKIQAQLSGWYTKFHDRQAQAYDPELDRSVFRNLGTVIKYGVDASVAYEPVRELTLYAFGSWNKSDIQDNIQIGRLPTGVEDCDAPNLPENICAFTAGNYESGTPKYMFGGSAVGRTGPFELGITAKRTGPRYVFDTNQPVFTGPIGAPTAEIFPAKAPAYWLVNLDARVKLDQWGIKGTYLQFNVYNLFDTFYVGGFGGGLNQSFSGANYGNPGFVQIGAPRTVSGTINLAF